MRAPACKPKGDSNRRACNATVRAEPALVAALAVAMLWSFQPAFAFQRRANDFPDDSTEVAYLKAQLGEEAGTQWSSFDGDDRRVRDARRALELDSTSAVAYQVLGIVYSKRHTQLARLLKTNFNGRLERMVGRARDRALRYLEKAFQVEPRRAAAYDHAMRFYVANGLFERADTTLMTMRFLVPDSANTWLYSGMITHYLENDEVAASYFEKASALLGDERWNRIMDPRMLLGNADKLDWSAVSDTSDFLQPTGDFWLARRPRYMVKTNERLVEHYARIVVADLVYPYWRKTSDDGWRVTPGEMIVRYGLPLDEVVWLGGYSRHLAMVFDDATFTFTDFTRNGEFEVIDKIGPGVSSSEGDNVRSARDHITTFPETYSYAGPLLQAEFPLMISVLGGNRENATTIFVTVGVPIWSEGEIRPGDAENIDLKVGTFLIDESHEVFDSDERKFYGLAPNSAQSTAVGETWCYTTSVQPSIGEYDLSVEFESQVSSTIGVSKSHKTIDRVHGDSLYVSDLLLAILVEEEEAARPGPCQINRLGVNITPSVASEFMLGQPVYLYFELAGLMPDSDGRRSADVEVSLEKIESASGVGRLLAGIRNRASSTVAVRTRVSSTLAYSGEYVILDTSDQTAGRYELSVLVTDVATGAVRRVTREIGLR